MSMVIQDEVLMCLTMGSSDNIVALFEAISESAVNWIRKSSIFEMCECVDISDNKVKILFTKRYALK